MGLLVRESGVNDDVRPCRLSRYIDRRWSEAEIPSLSRGCIPSLSRGWSDLDDIHLARLLSNHGQNAARLGRLLRDWCAVYGPLPDPVDRMIDDALDMLSIEWGVDLGTRDTPEDAPAELPIDIDELIVDLEDKCARLACHLDRCLQDGDDDRLPRLSSLYSRNAAHLGRLFRVRRALYPRTPEELRDLIASALDIPEDASQWDIGLSGDLQMPSEPPAIVS
jgi:hypothetical protein